MIAVKLNTAVGAPLLRILKTAYGADDQPVEHMVALYPADRYHVRMRLVENDDPLSQ
jgi:GntR family transcriptional regulator